MISKINKPLLPLRDIIIFPSMVVPLFVGREKSIRALNEVMKTDKSIILVAQKIQKQTTPRKKIYLVMDARARYYNSLNYPMEQ